jgi:tRNA-dihydrouridine synthase 3
MGTNLTRRFVCEAMSFTHRYVPVGLLERLPTHMNERAFPYKGRDELEVRYAATTTISVEAYFAWPADSACF